MSKYHVNLNLDKDYIKKIESYCNHEPANESECLGENETIDEEVQFRNGFRMAIQCCGVQYEENASENGSTNTAWTQAVLFDEKGHELACTEPGDHFMGDWIISYGKDTYQVTVKEK